jgi:membrane-associated phospholipid phosphatase
MTWETGSVLWLQSAPALALPMAAVSALGSPVFYLGLIAVLAWWRERPFALELGMLFAVSAIVNDLAKLLVHAPRPYWVSADVLPLEVQGSFGFPSAHAQLAFSIWGLIALRLRRPGAALAAAAVVFAIGVSRIALGVHYPVDVLGGWLIGAAVLAAFVSAGPAAFRAAGRMTPRGRILAAFVLSFAAVGASAAVAGAVGPWAPDPSWTGLVAGLAPVSIEYTLIAAGFGLGLVLGHELDRGCRSFRSRPAGLAGTVLGLAVMVLLWFGVEAVLPRGGPGADVVIYLAAAAIGAWCMAGAPALFCRLGLYDGAGPEHS